MPSPSDPLDIFFLGTRLRNPIVLAAGTHGTLDEISEVLDLAQVGAVVSKSITPQPREGNNTWRILPHPSPMGLGMLNAIGLANPGVDDFIRDWLPKVAAMPCPSFISVAGFSIDDYANVAGAIALAAPSSGFAGIELNLSCPNVKHGTEFGASPAGARDVVLAVRAVAPNSPIVVKLSPVAPELPAIARAVVEAGFTGDPNSIALTLGNTIPALAIDVETRRPLLANVTGGLSGPAIHSASVRAVWQVFSTFGKDLHGPGKHLPIIGLGGVSRWEDAAEFILAGASVVAIGTILFADPKAPARIVRKLALWTERQGCSSISQLVGGLRI